MAAQLEDEFESCAPFRSACVIVVISQHRDICAHASRAALLQVGARHVCASALRTLHTQQPQSAAKPRPYLQRTTRRYEQYLDSQITARDMYYLEDVELVRHLVELGCASGHLWTHLD